jgi:ribonuclease Z
MTTAGDIAATLVGYSRALYSNWLWHSRLRLLVDAGEGVHLALRSNVWQPDIVAITHGHSDHVLGLAGFAGARRFGKGATNKPWTVLYPAESSGVLAARELIAAMWRGVDFPIEWRAVADGDVHPIAQHRAIEVFVVTHVAPDPAVGYRVVERRRRLQAEYAGMATQEVEHLARSKGRESLMEDYQQVLFVHSGDAMPLPIETVRGAELVVHDATFLAAADRRDPIHASTEEVLVLARDAAVRALVLTHLSIRYERQSALAKIRGQRQAIGFTGDVWLLDEGTFHRM